MGLKPNSAKASKVALHFATSAALLLVADRGYAASYFCSPVPKEIGSYRPEDSSQELGITVQMQGAQPFWFDDETGDYLPYIDGAAGQLEPRKLEVPLTWPPAANASKAQATAAFAVVARQCQLSPMGIVPRKRS